MFILLIFKFSVAWKCRTEEKNLKTEKIKTKSKCGNVLSDTPAVLTKNRVICLTFVLFTIKKNIRNQYLELKIQFSSFKIMNKIESLEMVSKSKSLLSKGVREPMFRGRKLMFCCKKTPIISRDFLGIFNNF